MKKNILFVLLFSLLFSRETITLDFLKSKPKGIARDFYIWQFLQDPKTSLQEAIGAYELVFRKNDKIEQLITQKGYIHELPKEVQCKKLPFEQLITQDPECISYGLKLSHIPTLSSQKTKQLIEVLSQDYPLLSEEVRILREKNPLQSALQAQNAKIFSEIFYGLNFDQRLQYFNHQINPQALASLANQNDPNFNKMLQYILLSEHFKYFRQSILKAPITQVDERLLILLGISQLKDKNKEKAESYFKLAFKQAKMPLTKDKALFWQYLISKDPSLLKELAKSTELNPYTIFASQTLKTKPQYTIVSELPEIKEGQPNFDITNPFDWQILRKNLIDIPSGEELKPILDQTLAFRSSAPHFSVMLNRIKKFRNNYFLMPYASELSWKSEHQKALTFAIARQESNLIPALISTSYALGMMQIMPFNLKPIAKALGKSNMQLQDLFNPQVALEFGRFYLEELESEFKHPLFVAYAYNGGPGFWRRTLKKGQLFVKGGAYEPWISLELIPYEESKNYGPLVLTNYIIYQELLGNPINLENFLAQTLRKEK